MKLSEVKNNDKFICGEYEYKRICPNPDYENLIICKGKYHNFNLNADSEVRLIN